MPKRRDSGRVPPKDDDPDKPLPDPSEVERAIRRIVEKLRPKMRADKPKR